MAVYSHIKDIVSNLTGDTKFLQPLYEAIINSLEANATHIKINLQEENNLFNDLHSEITGFSIEDNGEAFNEKNVKAFNTLWTDNKRNIGCKGSGRFTWLKVFEKISITSFVKETQKQVNINFDLEYDRKVEEIPAKVNENKTIINFSKVNNEFCYYNSKKKLVDKREIADPNIIKNKIINYLLIKLFLMKKDKKDFRIDISCKHTTVSIIPDDIPNLLKKDFTIFSDINDVEYNFQIYYLVKKDLLNSKKMYFCANYRSTKEIDDDSLGFSCPLPNKDSFIMLLCSEYFEGKDNDSRSEFDKLSNVKTANDDVPLLISDITKEAKKQMQLILKELYPELTDLNNKAVIEAIEEAPYLANFIKEDTELIKSPKSLITNAVKKFNESKVKFQKQFCEALESKNITSEKFIDAVEKINIIAAAELGEYILYRENIIKALEQALVNYDSKEKFVHDILMPMKTSSISEDSNKHLLSNLWLIDDKFMTYSYAASDLTVKKIGDEIEQRNDTKYKITHRPDLTIFFNRKGINKDAIMVEFKGPHADIDEKNKSLTELPDDINIVRKNIDGIGTIWSYIITTLDADFVSSIENSENFTELFSCDSETKAYYRYLKKNNAHIYIIDIKSIVSDSFARNKTFLDILKNYE